MERIWISLLVVTFGWVGASCYDNPAACESADDCFAGEVCQEGVCTESSGPSDAGEPDDTSDDAADSDRQTEDSSAPDTAPDSASDGDGGGACTENDPCTADGEQCCSGACVDIRNSDSHCGSCGNACASGESCKSGTCETVSCTAPENCPAGAQEVECVEGECQAITCRSFNHPCDGGTKCCSWTSRGTASSPGVRSSVSFSYGQNDRKLVAFWEELNGNRSDRVVQLARAPDGSQSWTVQQISQEQPAGSGLTMRTDSNRRAHFLYGWDSGAGGPTDEEMRWARPDSTNNSWSVATELTNRSGEKWALALDSADRPHVVVKNGTKAEYSYLDSGGWSSRSLGSAANSAGSKEGLEIDSDDQPHLVFRDGYSKIVYKTRTGTSNGFAWTTEEIDPNNQSFSADLELTSGDEPEVAYQEANSNKVFFATRNSNGTWSKTKISDSGEEVRFEIDGDGTRRVYFLQSTSNGFDVKAARRIRGNWNVKTLRSESDNLVANDLDVALDSEGRPGLAYTADGDIEVIEW